MGSGIFAKTALPSRGNKNLTAATWLSWEYNLSAIAFACLAYSSHFPPLNNPSHWAARKRILEASCPLCFIRYIKSEASWFLKKTTASPKAKPFFVPPKDQNVDAHFPCQFRGRTTSRGYGICEPCSVDVNGQTFALGEIRQFSDFIRSIESPELRRVGQTDARAAGTHGNRVVRARLPEDSLDRFCRLRHPRSRFGVPGSGIRGHCIHRIQCVNVDGREHCGAANKNCRWPNYLPQCH